MLQVFCDHCKHELIVPGAIILGPPVKGKCNKFHICLECWFEYVIDLIT
jgi:hypothetical protein